MSKNFNKAKNNMSKIGFKLNAARFSILRGEAHSSRVVSLSQAKVTRIVLRKDEEVRNSQVKGYKYLLP